MLTQWTSTGMPGHYTQALWAGASKSTWGRASTPQVKLFHAPGWWCGNLNPTWNSSISESWTHTHTHTQHYTQELHHCVSQLHSLMCRAEPILLFFTHFSSSNSFFITYFAQDFAQNFSILLTIKLQINCSILSLQVHMIAILWGVDTV